MKVLPIVRGSIADTSLFRAALVASSTTNIVTCNNGRSAQHPQYSLVFLSK